MFQPSETESFINSSDVWHITGKPPAAFFARKLTSLSTCRDVIGCFDLPQTQRERNAVQFSAAVCGGGVLRDATKNGCVGDYTQVGIDGKSVRAQLKFVCASWSV